mmetsp:Transcript_101524/g.302874  ORF Transcript_101524/g.302874 Transcript_101524/m.302874 type:complete len:141 (-) Transcript_101524:210-632(-)
MEAPEACWQGLESGNSSGLRHRTRGRSSAGSSGGRRRGSTLLTGDRRGHSDSPQRTRPYRQIEQHTGIDFELYRQAYLPYRNEEHYLRELRARLAEAPRKESRGSRVWRRACEIAGSVRAHIPRMGHQSSSEVEPFSERL